MGTAPTSKNTLERTLDPARLGDHVDRLYRAAWGLCGSRADAEDLVQDTFAHVLAKPRRIRHGDDLAYLLKALRNTYFSSRRTASRRIAPVDPPVGFEAADASSRSRPQEALAAREVFVHIAALADAQKDALVAIDIVGLTYREAGELLGTKEATIASRVHRARIQVARGMKTASSGVML